MTDENTKTEIVTSENVMLAREHLKFLDQVVEQLNILSNYRTTKSQIIRLLIEGAMEKEFNFSKVNSESDLKLALNDSEYAAETRIQSK